MFDVRPRGAAHAESAEWVDEDTEADSPQWQSAGDATLSCPRYSGPGWTSEHHPGVTMSGASETQLFSHVHPAQESARLPLSPLPPGAVRLTPGASPYADAAASNVDYLLSLDPERLVYSFRAQAGLAQAEGATPYGGWEHPGSELRGHFVGHYLSATAAALSATGDQRLSAAMLAVVTALQACQTAQGYLSAFPTSLLDRFENQTLVWAPYYTLHKVLAGLLDAHKLGGSTQAGAMARRLAAYIDARAQAVVRSRGLQHWRECLNLEHGGIAEALRAAGARFERGAQYWDKPCFHGPLASGHDPLAGLHANTHLPMVSGALARFANTGEQAFLAAAVRFFALMNDTRTYATGGTSHGELWHEAGLLGSGLGGPSEGGTHSAESCATHNALKTATTLLRTKCGASARVAYADYIERATLNGILGAQRGSDLGRYLYMYPMGVGVSKAQPSQWRKTGWSSPYDDFWCCCGTMVESFARFGDGVYLEHGLARRLFVLHYVTSTLRWDTAGLEVTQESSAALWTASAEANASLTVQLRASPLRGHTPVRAALSLRIPSWVSPDSQPPLAAWLNDSPLLPGVGVGVGVLAPGRFFTVAREWGGDTLRLRVPLGAARAERIADSREPFKHLFAILWGPLVLAGLTDESRTLAGSSASVAALAAILAPVPDSARAQLASFTAPDGRYLTRTAGGGVRWADPPAEMPGPARHRLGGTDAHSRAVWRLVALREGAVALEAMDRPGAFLCLKSGGAASMALGEHSADPLQPSVPPCGEWRTHMQQNPSGGIVLESVAASGTYLCASPGDEDVQLRQSREGCAPLTQAPPIATLPAVAFWALGGAPGLKFLLMPLSDILDETYSAYMEIREAV